jgi:hypothetical protein
MVSAGYMLPICPHCDSKWYPVSNEVHSILWEYGIQGHRHHTFQHCFCAHSRMQFLFCTVKSLFLEKKGRVG